MNKFFLEQRVAPDNEHRKSLCSHEAYIHQSTISCVLVVVVIVVGDDDDDDTNVTLKQPCACAENKTSS